MMEKDQQILQLRKEIRSTDVRGRNAAATTVGSKLQRELSRKKREQEQLDFPSFCNDEEPAGAREDAPPVSAGLPIIRRLEKSASNPQVIVSPEFVAQPPLADKSVTSFVSITNKSRKESQRYNSSATDGMIEMEVPVPPNHASKASSMITSCMQYSETAPNQEKQAPKISVNLTDDDSQILHMGIGEGLLGVPNSALFRNGSLSDVSFINNNGIGGNAAPIDLLDATCNYRRNEDLSLAVIVDELANTESEQR